MLFDKLYGELKFHNILSVKLNISIAVGKLMPTYKNSSLSSKYIAFTAPEIEYDVSEQTYLFDKL